MSRSDNKRLDDIVSTIAEVADIVGRGRTAFDSDVALRRAMERCLEIIGEASKALGENTRASIQGVPWSAVMRLRDLLSHHYHRVEPDQIWTTAVEEIPSLETAIGSWRTGREVDL